MVLIRFINVLYLLTSSTYFNFMKIFRMFVCPWRPMLWGVTVQIPLTSGNIVKLRTYTYGYEYRCTWNLFFGEGGLKLIETQEVVQLSPGRNFSIFFLGKKDKIKLQQNNKDINKLDYTKIFEMYDRKRTFSRPQNCHHIFELELQTRFRGFLSCKKCSSYLFCFTFRLINFDGERVAECWTAQIIQNWQFYRYSRVVPLFQQFSFDQRFPKLKIQEFHFHKLNLIIT